MMFIIVALAALMTTAAAHSSSPWYNVQSNEFRLVLKSANDTLDGYLLAACHQGAAIEGLCLTGETVEDPAAPYTTFYHNVSSSEGKSANAVDTLGVLNYILIAGGGLKVPSAMNFYQHPGSNLGDLIFRPGWTDYTTVAFDECGSMYIPVYQDDTVSPPTSYKPTLKLKNWYICLTRYSYLYNTLVFKVGVTGQPQNPTCVAVEVERVWV